MRKLVYDCIKDGAVVKTVTSYREANNWANKDNCEFETRLEDFEIEKEKKETKERRNKRLEKIEALTE